MPSIEPDNFLKLLWDVMMIAFFLILFLSFPIQMSFDLQKFWLLSYFESFDQDSFNIEIIFIILYLLNILIKLNLAYYDKGELNIKQ